MSFRYNRRQKYGAYLGGHFSAPLTKTIVPFAGYLAGGAASSAINVGTGGPGTPITIPYSGTSSNNNGIIVKFDTSDAVLWANRVSSITGQVGVGGLAVDPLTNDIFVTGTATETNDSDDIYFYNASDLTTPVATLSIPTKSGNTNNRFVWVAKYTFNGTLLWARIAGYSTIGVNTGGAQSILSLTNALIVAYSAGNENANITWAVGEVPGQEIINFNIRQQPQVMSAFSKVTGDRLPVISTITRHNTSSYPSLAYGFRNLSLTSGDTLLVTGQLTSYQVPNWNIYFNNTTMPVPLAATSTAGYNVNFGIAIKTTFNSATNVLAPDWANTFSVGLLNNFNNSLNISGGFLFADKRVYAQGFLNSRSTTVGVTQTNGPTTNLGVKQPGNCIYALYSANGSLLWQTSTFSNTNTSSSTFDFYTIGAAVDADNTKIYANGVFIGSTTLPGGAVLNGTNYLQPFVGAIDINTGNFVWSDLILLNTSGNVLMLSSKVVGATVAYLIRVPASRTLTFSDGTVISTNNNNTLVKAVWDLNGNFITAYKINDTPNTTLSAVHNPQ